MSNQTFEAWLGKKKKHLMDAELDIKSKNKMMDVEFKVINEGIQILLTAHSTLRSKEAFKSKEWYKLMDVELEIKGKKG